MDQPAISDPEDPEPKPAVIQQAAEWMAHIEAGDMDDADVRAFQRWQAEHPSHAIAIKRMGGLDRDLQGEPLRRETLRRLFLRPRRNAGVAGLVLVLVIAGGMALTRLPSVEPYLADERTNAGEMRSVALKDGSKLVLASDTVVDLNIGHGSRSVQLLRGELLAEVARGQAERFRIETPEGSAEALGTEFTVRRDGTSTFVSVISSQVRACAKGAHQDACVILSPGERAQISEGKVWYLADVAPRDAAAWTEGWLTANDMPLAEVLDGLNRWRKNPIRFDRQALSGMKVSGVFPLSDTDGALTNLAHSQSLSVDRSDPQSPFVRRDAK